MAVNLDTPITWRSAVVLGLGLAAEYGLLALIEDGPIALKVATMLCAAGALVVVQTENWLKRQQRHLFVFLLAVLAITYVGFATYAVRHAVGRDLAIAELKTRYVQSGELIGTQIPMVQQPSGSPRADEEAIKRFVSNSRAWEKDTAQWIGDNVGAAARERFLDYSGYLPQSYFIQNADGSQIVNNDYSAALNGLAKDRRNLSVLIESPAYVQ